MSDLSGKQAVILAGGLGTRLKPITEKIPKPLAEVKGKPFLYWQLKELEDQGIRRVLLLCSYLGEMIQEYFGEYLDQVKLTYSFEKTPMGTGGALKLAYEKLDDDFFVINGDSFTTLSLSNLLSFYRSQTYHAVMSAFVGVTKVKYNLKIQGSSIVDYKKGGGKISFFRMAVAMNGYQKGNLGANS